MNSPKKDGRKKWVKLWTQSWLRGPISKQDLATRAIFAGLLALAGDNVGSEKQSDHQGMVRVASGCGFTDGQIAKMLNVREETWVHNKRILIEIKHITATQANEIQVLEWTKYQADYIRVQEHRAKKARERVTKRVTSETQNVTDRSKKEKKEGEGKKEKLFVEDTKVSSLSETRVSSQSLLEYWNAKGRMIQARSWGEARAKKLRARCKDKSFVAYWREAIDAVSYSSWHTGDNTDGWVADLGWFLSLDKHKNTNWNKCWEKGITADQRQAKSKERMAEIERKLDRADEERREQDKEPLTPEAQALVRKGFSDEYVME